MLQKNALSRTVRNSPLKLASFALAFLFSATSCSDSNSPTEQIFLDDSSTPEVESQQLTNDNDNQPVFQIFSEMGDSGMRVTYSPMSLMTYTNVEELERVYVDLMACVGLSTVTPPSILLSDDESLFHVRDDGTDVQGYYDEDTSLVTVYADDLDASHGNQYWWTRHGMIEYLINVHDLSPDSTISPFMSCHWA